MCLLAVVSEENVSWVDERPPFLEDIRIIDIGKKVILRSAT